MEAKIINQDLNSIKIEIEISITRSMLTTEENIQHAVNSVGRLATEYSLAQFDTDGSPIKVCGNTYTSKGLVTKTYQTPYGEAIIDRHVYQSNQGGITFCPLEKEARIIVGSTPKFAKMVSSKYSNTSAISVMDDLNENHGRYISRTYIQDISEAVAKTIQEKSEKWEYTVPVSEEDASVIGISLDGTCMLMVNDGYRVAMVGAISIYDKEGERLYTHYTSSAPEYGKATFYKEFDKEITRIQRLYPNAKSVGVADGAKDNWTFLSNYTKIQILDYFHATEYLAKVAENGFKEKWKGKNWLTDACHILKHEKNGAKEILKEIKSFRTQKISSIKMKKIESSITYFENHLQQMDYNKYKKNNYPIGSGVIESACGVIIKQRLCNSGMRWKEDGAKTVLRLRCINQSDGKWSQVWNKINKYGK